MSTAMQVLPNTTDVAQPVAVVPRPQLGLVRPIAEPSALLQVQEETRRLITALLVEGRDYGVIPGVDKPSLLKPGAERIGIAFGCYSRFRIVEQEIDHDRRVEWQKKKAKWDTVDGRRQKVGEDVTTGVSLGLYRYVVECEIVHRETGLVVGSCLGVASTMESKYIDRPREMENTIAKMAEKRAHVGAVLNAFGLSEQFTQDVEDNPAAYGHGEQHAPAATASAEPAKAKPAAKAGDGRVTSCPKCGGPTWDNRPKKASGEYKVSAPDFSCRDKTCGGKVWPVKAGAKQATEDEGDAYREGENAPPFNDDIDIPF